MTSTGAHATSGTIDSSAIRGRGSRFLCGLLALAFVASCGSDDSPRTAASDAASSSSPPLAVPQEQMPEALSPEWQEIAQRLESGEPTTPELAVSMFELAFVSGPLDPYGALAGQETLDLLSEHWLSFTDAEQARIEAALQGDQFIVIDDDGSAPVDSLASGLRASALQTGDALVAADAPRQVAQPAPPSLELLKATVAKVHATLVAKLGPLRLAISVGVEAEGSAFAVAKPAYSLEPGDTATLGSERMDDVFAACHMFIQKKGLSLAGTQLEYALAHELAHCFQFRDQATKRLMLQAPKWLEEGLAEWVAYQVYDGTLPAGLDQRFAKWFGTNTTSLTAHSYDAVGFWTLVAEVVGPDQLYSNWTGIVRSWPGGTKAVFAAIGVDQNLFEQWASSSVRRPALGDPWDVEGRFLGSEATEAEPVGVLPAARSANFQLDPLSWRVLDVAPMDGGLAFELTVNSGVVRLHAGGSDETLTHGGRLIVCLVPEECECSTDEIPRVEADVSSTTDTAVVGITGDHEGADVNIRSMARSELCGAPGDLGCSGFDTRTMSDTLGVELAFDSTYNTTTYTGQVVETNCLFFGVDSHGVINESATMQLQAVWDTSIIGLDTYGEYFQRNDDGTDHSVGAYGGSVYCRVRLTTVMPIPAENVEAFIALCLASSP